MTHEFSNFLNREIGWLKFNKRVLAQAEDLRVPLLERVRFLNIFNSNLDEFFMKRVGGLQRQFYSSVAHLSNDGLTPEEQLKWIRTKVLSLNEQIEELLKKDLLPKLKEQGISLVPVASMTDREHEWARQFFREKIFPVLTPMAVDPGHPFPLISNLSTSLAISLRHPNEEELLFARIKIPDVFPTWLRIPDTPAGQEKFVATAEIVEQNLAELFPRMQIVSVMPFRVTRNIDVLEADEEGVEDLLEHIEEEVRQRRFAEIVRIEHGPHPDSWLLQFLVDELEVGPEEIYEFPYSLAFKNLSPIAELNFPHHKFKPLPSVTPLPLIEESVNIFNVIRSSDLLVHHPYESFSSTVERFIQTAASDPQVVAIKMTLYRTGERSQIAHSLIRAAEAGKQVVCLIELKARLEEERNIYWAQAMERAGVHVVYGIVGLKTHAKIALVVRQEKDEFRSYAHIGTGNYHPQTAKFYTDAGLLTARPEITSELVEVFHYLTGRSLKTDYNNLLVAPVNLRAKTLDMIRMEAENALAGRPSGIIAKFNNLEDRQIIEGLYEASQAGVPIQLIVRGFSCLRPETIGLSETIHVMSILGPYLEHSRIFYYRNGEQDPLNGLFYIGSADWMTRNHTGRVEVLTPVVDKVGREKLWESLQIMLKDQRLAWDMGPEGHYVQRQPRNSGEEIGCHELLSERARLRNLVAKPIEGSEAPGAHTSAELKKPIQN